MLNGFLMFSARDHRREARRLGTTLALPGKASKTLLQRFDERIEFAFGSLFLPAIPLLQSTR
jgi:hypothetical protein